MINNIYAIFLSNVLTKSFDTKSIIHTAYYIYIIAMDYLQFTNT